MNVVTRFMEAFHLARARDATDPVATPEPLPSVWVGLDRRDIPQNNTIKPNEPSPAAIDWFRALTDHSNFRFCGAYLTGKSYPTGANESQFTDSATQIKRNWVPNVRQMRGDLGWGTMLFYMGYSVGGKYPMPPGITNLDTRGRMHARHAKMIVAAIDPSLDSVDGAVVILDNEDHAGNIFDEKSQLLDASRVNDLKEYYKAFFEQLQEQEAGLPLLRIGVYADPKVVNLLFLADHPELFVWLVDYGPQKSLERESPPFVNADPQNTDPLNVDLSHDFSLPLPDPDPQKALEIARKTTALTHNHTKLQPLLAGKSGNQYAWPLGRQFRNPQTVGIPPDNSRLLTSAPVIKQTKNWDFSSALVRDPMYPVGEPRIAFTPGTPMPNGTLVAGRFLLLNPPTQMKVDIFTDTGALVVPAPAQYVEPDAPIVQATFLGATESYFASILQDGDIAVFSSADLQWKRTNSSATKLPRRLRAISLVAFKAPGVTDLWLFYIGSDRALYGMSRPMPSGSWSPPAMPNVSLSIHPFSAVAAASRATKSVDVFVINSAKLLTTVSWAASTTWPSATSQPIETGNGIFLPTTALAAVSATPAKLHVFGVGKVGDALRLHYVEFTEGSGWGPVTALGAAKHFVSPHTRIAVHAVSATRVEVAAISDTGNVRVHTLVPSGSTWIEDSRIDLPSPGEIPTAVDSPFPVIEKGVLWRINPFGDLAIGVVGGRTMVFAAGVSRGATAVLRYSIATGSRWERYH